MDFGLVELTEEQQQFHDEARAFFAEHITEEIYQHERDTGDGFHEGVHLELGKRGWVMPRWPVEQGGAGLDSIQSRLLDLEMNRIPIPWVSISTTKLVVEAVQQHGSEELKAEVLAPVATGAARFCLGYTEPDGGSDIAAAKTRAVRDGDEWVINGSKIFTTGAHNCQYTFLITRTDPDAPKHKGLTMFLVPLNTPGVEIQGIWAFSGERTNIVYYADVRIPDRYRLGAVNAGWGVLHGPLDAEHSIDVGKTTDQSEVGLEHLSIGSEFTMVLARALDAAVDWALTATLPDGSHPADDPLVRYRLGEVATQIEAAMSTPGAMGRVKGAEVFVAAAADLIDLIGAAALLPHGAPGVIGDGEIDFGHRFAQGTATYGGTVEVFRTIIAQHVLNLPKPDYPGSKKLISSRRSTAAA
jgi:alkylation response protein AidB-like acyl-CoA dehydrogenase